MQDAAATAGLISNRMPFHICTGRVMESTPLTNRATTISSKLVRKAKIAPARTPGKMAGRVTFLKAIAGISPEAAGGVHHAPVELLHHGRDVDDDKGQREDGVSNDEPEFRANDAELGEAAVEGDGDDDARHDHRQQEEPDDDTPPTFPRAG